MKTLFSKSEYMMYRKHPAWLWLKKNDPKKLPPIDDNLQALFDGGNQFEALAEQTFEGVVRAGFENYQQYLDLPRRTKELLAGGTKILSQGRFESEKLTCICDIVEQIDSDTLDLIEIKSSTQVKPDHIEDLAFQCVVLEAAGYNVRNISVVYCNNQYVRQGEVDVHKIAARENVTTQVRLAIEDCKKTITKALEVMQQPQMPNPSPAFARGGGFYEWLGIYTSLFPPSQANSIYDLCRLNSQLLAQLEHSSITTIADIPLDLEELNAAQRRQIKAVQTGTYHIDMPKIHKFLQKLEFPLYFLDYETLSGVVPAHNGTRPYQQVAFQYSLHILDAPGAELRHTEYLHTSSTLPPPQLLAQMKQDIGPVGSVLVWYQAFEKTRNTEMAELLPEYADFLAQLNERVVDLMVPFSKGWYVDAGFRGSASIKNVLPVLVPELSYKELEIQEGVSAQRLWMKAVLGGELEGKSEDFEALMQNLREYCKLDTLAMVRIYEFLVGLTLPTRPTLEQLSLL